MTTLREITNLDTNLLAVKNAHSFDKRIKFQEEGHIYWIDGDKTDLISSTTFIKSFFNPFDSNGDKFQVDSKLTSKVNFERRDLLNGTFDKNFHLILCRNVVIYFTEEAKEKLYTDFYNSLTPGGVLFIGSTERIHNFKEIGYNLTSSFFYQK